MKNLFIKFRLPCLLLCMALSSIFTSFCVFADENPEDWITKKPSGGIFLEGESITLDVTLASIDGLSCQWYKDGNIISGATGTSYTINNLTLDDGGEYSVVISKNVEEEILTTTSSTIVTVVKEIEMSPKKIFTEGKDKYVTFQIEAHGGNLTYTWEKEGNPISNETGSSYKINDVVLDHGAVYTVVVKNDENESRDFSKTLTVVKEIEMSPSPERIFIEGEKDDKTVTFQIEARGGDVTYTWKKDGNPISNETGSSYKIDNVGLNDGAVYTVTIENGEDDPLDFSKTLTVAKPITADPDTPVEEGKDITLKVEAKGGNLTYQWNKEVTDNSGSTRYQKISGATSSSYSIKKAKLDHSGNYTVTIKNNEEITRDIGPIYIDIFALWPSGMVYKYIIGSGWQGTHWKRACDLEDTEIPSGEFAVICHGMHNALYNSSGEWIENIAGALQSQGIKDVFAIDWGNFSFDGWDMWVNAGTTPAHHIPKVANRASYLLFGTSIDKNDWGKTYGNFIPSPKLVDSADPKDFKLGKDGKKLNPSKAHFIGHSHGAHVLGNIAKMHRVKRLTLLDASPRLGGHQWIVPAESCKWVSNAKNCAEFVEFYKSSQLMSWDDPIGHINFLVGKDRTSPRSLANPVEDHSFSHQWYLNTITNKNYNDKLTFQLGYPLSQKLMDEELETTENTVSWINFATTQFIGVIQCNGADYQLDVLERWMTDDKYKQWQKDYKGYLLDYQGKYSDADDAVKRHSKMVDIYLSPELNVEIPTKKYEKGKSIDFQIAAEDYLLSSKLRGDNALASIQEEVEITFYLDTIKDNYKGEKSAAGFPIEISSQKLKLSSGISNNDTPKGDKTFKISIPEKYDKNITDYLEKNKNSDPHLYIRAEVTRVQDVNLGINEDLIDVYKPNGQTAIEITVNQERYAVLCNDNSGSMGWNDPNGQRKNAMEHFLDKLNQILDKAALINFESSVTSSTGFEEPKNLKSKIQIRDGGGTDIAAAINRAISMLQSSVNEIKKNAAIYVLTDGENGAGDAPVINAISRAGSLGIRVHYGHFGGSVFGASDLEPATVNLSSSDSDVELASSYNTIAEAVIATGGIYGEIRTADDIEPFVDLIFRSGLTMDDPSDKSTVPGQMRIYDIMYEGQEEVEYWFAGREKEEIGITVTGIDYYPEITLFDEDENQLEEDLNEDGDRIAEITTTLPYTGMYKVRIKAKNGGYGLYNIFVDVANAVVENVTDHVTTSFSSWKVDPNTGALVGDLVLHNNEDSPKLLQKSFWYALPEEDSLKLANTDGTNSDGIPYMDITQLVEVQLPNIGNGDLVLDPGETVVISGITVYSKDRSIPQGQLYAIWADPPKAKITLPKLNAALSKDGSTVSISWESLEVESAASASYIVEESDSLTHPNWNPVSAETVLQNQKEVLVVPASNGTKFYRLRQK